VSAIDQVVEEMLEPVGGFPSKLEWLAHWLDGMDRVIEGATDEPMDDEVQCDLRRWAETLRSRVVDLEPDLGAALERARGAEEMVAAFLGGDKEKLLDTIQILGLPARDVSDIFAVVQEWHLRGGRPSLLELYREIIELRKTGGSYMIRLHDLAQNVVDSLWTLDKIAAEDGDFEQAFVDVKAHAFALRRALEIGEGVVARG